MRYRVMKKESCLIEGAWAPGWTVQMWADTGWVDVTRPYREELEAREILDVLKK